MLNDLGRVATTGLAGEYSLGVHCTGDLAHTLKEQSPPTEMSILRSKTWRKPANVLAFAALTLCMLIFSAICLLAKNALSSHGRTQSMQPPRLPAKAFTILELGCPAWSHCQRWFLCQMPAMQNPMASQASWAVPLSSTTASDHHWLGRFGAADYSTSVPSERSFCFAASRSKKKTHLPLNTGCRTSILCLCYTTAAKYLWEVGSPDIWSEHFWQLPSV